MTGATKNAPYSQEHLAHCGAAILCLNCPTGLEFGLDLHQWTIGPKFLGVKWIPPGAHFVHYVAESPGGAGGGMVPSGGGARCGFFCFLKPSQILVRRWCAESETLEPLECPDEELRFQDGVRHFEFDLHMGPYPWQDDKAKSLWTSWRDLSSFVSWPVIEKIEPVAKSRTVGGTSLPLTRDEKALIGEEVEKGGAGGGAAGGADASGAGGGERDLASDDTRAEHAQFGRLFFSTIPKVKTGGLKKLSPAEITRLYHDKSDVVRRLVRHEYSSVRDRSEEKLKEGAAGHPDEHDTEDSDFLALLGELQAAFVVFLLGQHYEAFEQWKSLLVLLTSCEALVEDREGIESSVTK